MKTLWTDYKQINEIWWESGRTVLRLMKSLTKIVVFQNWPKLNRKDKLTFWWRNGHIWGCASTKKNQKIRAKLNKIVNSCVSIALFQPKSDDVVVTRALLMTEPFVLWSSKFCPLKFHLTIKLVSSNIENVTIVWKKYHVNYLLSTVKGTTDRSWLVVFFCQNGW